MGRPLSTRWPCHHWPMEKYMHGAAKGLVPPTASKHAKWRVPRHLCLPTLACSRETTIIGTAAILSSHTHHFDVVLSKQPYLKQDVH